jgi:hypothetical protein
MIYWLQVLDLAAISLFIAYLLSASLRRSWLVSDFRRPFILFTLAGVLLPFVDPRLGYANLAAQGTAVATLWSPALFSAAHQRRDLLSAAVVLGAGLVALILDFRQVACVPGALGHVLQPHAFWHLFSALLLFYLYRHERHLEFASTIAV